MPPKTGTKHIEICTIDINQPHLLLLQRLTVAASGRHSPVCISQWPLAQSHSACRKTDIHALHHIPFKVHRSLGTLA